jgi:phytoene/squalene synthetase
MKSLFDKLSVRVSKDITHAYSTSFSLSIYFLGKRLRNAVYAVYGFVRVADEIVDSFEGYDKEQLLAQYYTDTFAAIEKGISVNPVLNSFQNTVNRYHISNELIVHFLESMAMDLQKINYTEEKYHRYISGSAEAVGLMCLHIFTEGDTHKYEELKPYAMRLGAAFQKINFLRDIKSDYEDLGRIYFPGASMQSFSREVKMQIEKEIEEDFRVGLEGIKKLPPSSRCGVYVAYVYYRALFKKIKKLSPQKVLNGRIRIHNGRKIGILVNSFVEYKLRVI